MKNKFRTERYIYQEHSDNSWKFRVRYNGTSKTFNEKDYISAAKAFNDAIAYRNKLLVTPEEIISTITVNEVWQEVNQIYALRAETQRKLNIQYNKYIHNKDKALKDITRADIISDLNSMVDQASDDTIQRVLSIWKKIFGTAIAKEYVHKDITTTIKVPQSRKLKPQKRNEEINEEIIEELSKALKKGLRFDIEKNQANDVLLMLYYTGMRPGEMFALTKKDINLKDNTISINKELGYDENREPIIRPCKTEMSHRVIPIPDKLNQVVRNLYKAKSNILFPNHNGKYHNITDLGQKYHLIANSVGIDFHFYQCRHSFITNLVHAGIDIKTIQELVGQSIDQTTIGYVISSKERQKNAINSI